MHRFLSPCAGASGWCALLLLLTGVARAADPQDPAKENEPPPAKTVEDLQGKVSLGLNTGGHTAPITVMAFTPDGSKLITARGGEVMVWDVATGAREHVWRLPTGVIALAPFPKLDKLVAGGGAQLQADGKTRDAPLWLLDLKTGEAETVRPHINSNITSLAVSPDGARLAWANGTTATVYDRATKTRTHVIAHGQAVRQVAFIDGGKRLLTAEDPGDRNYGCTCLVWDLPAPKPKETVKPFAPVITLWDSEDHWVTWSPSTKRFALLRAGGKHGLLFWSAGGTHPEQSYEAQELDPIFGAGGWSPGGIYWLPSGQVLATVARWKDAKGFRQTATAAIIDPKTGKLVKQVYQGPAQDAGAFASALSPNGKLLAVTGDPGYEVILIDVGTKEEVVRLGPPAPTPRFAGWSADGKTIVWGFSQPAKQPRVMALSGGLNLTTLEPLVMFPQLDQFIADQKKLRDLLAGKAPDSKELAEEQQRLARSTAELAKDLHARMDRDHPEVAQHADKAVTLQKKTGGKISGGDLPGAGGDARDAIAELEAARAVLAGDLLPGSAAPAKWTIATDRIGVEVVIPKTTLKRWDFHDGVVLVNPDGKRIDTPIGGAMTAFTFYKDGKSGEERVAVAVGRSLFLYDPKTNKVVRQIKTGANKIDDVAVSPDGKYLLVAWGNQALTLFNLQAEGEPQPLLYVLVADRDWVAWTKQGYYAATPGGEKLIGWLVKRDDDTPLDFYPVERFRKLFYQPDVIKQLLATGSVEEALKAGKVRGVTVENSLPPAVTITVKETKPGYAIKAEAAAGSKDQPVQSLQLLLDGRPLDGAKVWNFDKGQEKAEAEWAVAELPGGHHELKVLARGKDVSGVSAAHVLGSNLPDADKPLLYRICVGVNDYDKEGLKLGSAKQDAEAVFDALEKYCTGKGNCFRAAAGVKLLDKAATRAAVLEALKNVRKEKVKPGDLVVVFFGGHGIVQRGEFYLLTREADPGKDLNGQSLSGKDLQDAFADMPCSVLLLMDACHSTAGAVALKPATDDLTRSLSDDQVAVTVLAAAMGYETAGERTGHGLFTEALLKGLEAGAGVPYDPHDHQMYVHHLYSHVFSEVRRASAGRQNPFLNMPWTVPPLAIRQLPAK
jgi:WD40 repeat protein